MRYVAGLCALVALVAIGWGYTRSSSNTSTRTVTVTRTIVHTLTRAVTTTTPSSATNGCAASDLTGAFAVVEGSAGGGNIVYTLRATNAGQGPCTVSGTPTIFFLDASGHVLPSKTSAEGGTAAVVTLQPGDTATAQVRFSPDVTPCDNGSATTIRTELPDKSTFDAKIDPATKLCGAGSLQPSPWAGAS